MEHQIRDDWLKKPEVRRNTFPVPVPLIVSVPQASNGLTATDINTDLLSENPDNSAGDTYLNTYKHRIAIIQI
jgi:hypothetical protein